MPDIEDTDKYGKTHDWLGIPKEARRVGIAYTSEQVHEVLESQDVVDARKKLFDDEHRRKQEDIRKSNRRDARRAYAGMAVAGTALAAWLYNSRHETPPAPSVAVKSKAESDLDIIPRAEAEARVLEAKNQTQGEFAFEKNKEFLNLEIEINDAEINKLPVGEYKPVDTTDILSLARNLKNSGYDGIHLGEGSHLSAKQYDDFLKLLTDETLGVNLLFIENPKLSKEGDSPTTIQNKKYANELTKEYYASSPELAKKNGKLFDAALQKFGSDKLQIYFTDNYDDAHFERALAIRADKTNPSRSLSEVSYHLGKANRNRNSHMGAVMAERFDEQLHRNPPSEPPFFISQHGISHIVRPDDADEIAKAKMGDFDHSFHTANIYVLPVNKTGAEFNGKIFRKPGTGDFVYLVYEPELPAASMWEVFPDGKVVDAKGELAFALDLQALKKGETIPAVDVSYAKRVLLENKAAPIQK